MVNFFFKFFLSLCGHSMSDGGEGSLWKESLPQTNISSGTTSDLWVCDHLGRPTPVWRSRGLGSERVPDTSHDDCTDTHNNWLQFRLSVRFPCRFSVFSRLESVERIYSTRSRNKPFDPSSFSLGPRGIFCKNFFEERDYEVGFLVTLIVLGENCPKNFILIP